MEQAVDIDQAKICRELAPEVAVFIRVGAVEVSSIFGVEGDVSTLLKSPPIIEFGESGGRRPSSSVRV
jgi:hypothetical protein